eukprot:365737-Chlamydomonas_euryale.AAC.9
MRHQKLAKLPNLSVSTFMGHAWPSPPSRSATQNSKLKTQNAPAALAARIGCWTWCTLGSASWACGGAWWGPQSAPASPWQATCC